MTPLEGNKPWRGSPRLAKPKKEQLGVDIETPIEELRHIVHNFDSCNETFNQRWTLPQLVILHRAWMESGWDIYPDNWTERQLREALRGIPPKWDSATERPVYG